MNYAKMVTGGTPQSRPIRGRESEMVKNSAGGFVFQISLEERVRRFLILGSDSPTYYTSAQELTEHNVNAVVEMAKSDPLKCVEIVLDVSKNGKAMRNDAAIFALALMAERGTPESRKLAFIVANDVCRTGTHFFLFNSYLNTLGGKSNRSRRNMVSRWYTSKNASGLAYQVLKYRSRYDLAHHDLINLGHASFYNDRKAKSVINYVMTGKIDENAPRILEGYGKITSAKTESEAVALIGEYGMTWEFVPSQWLESNAVWEALLPNLPYTALIRNLGQLTARGVIAPMTSNSKYVVEKLVTPEGIKRARVHPLSILVAQRVYGQGKGVRGGKEWRAVPAVLDALEAAFYASFQYVEPSGKNLFFGIDASGSTAVQVGRDIPLSVCEAEAVMAMASARTEQNTFTEAFAYGKALGVNITKSDSLSTAMRVVDSVNTGSTDLSGPMDYATMHGMDVDCFVIMTDNETWAGRSHPVEALKEYRRKAGKPDAKMVVAAFTSTGFSIADPEDPNNLDIVGLDTSVPQLVTNFARGM